MRRTARLLTGGALAAVAAAGPAAPVHAAGHEASPAHLPAARQPQARTGGVTAGLEVRPVGVVPGERVTVRTAACGKDGTAAGDAGAVGAGRFTLVPGPHRDGATGGFRVPPSAQPGTYEIVAQCAEGGRRLTGDLVVALASERRPAHPRGSVKTGVGGALGPDPVQTAAGVAALAVAAAGGTWLLHRRARGDGI